MKLSVVLATRNEEENIGRCLESVKNIADEIIIFDEYSTDKTVEVARKYGAKVYNEPHHDNFHITKQKAIDKANGDWILQMDADETITTSLSKEIESIVKATNGDLLKKKLNLDKNTLYTRHMRALEERDGKIGESTGEIVAFLIPRINIFLGKPLVHAGVYPDPAIRLIKNGKACLPAKSVHEIMEVKGETSWTENAMEHYDSPTFERYLLRANRYTDLTAEQMKAEKIKLNIRTLLYYSFVKPSFVFLSLYLRHLGILDGMRGFIWSLFSALHFPISYFKYYTLAKNGSLATLKK
jgi:glycosyltransferase involved in cell wall biosynthesis